MKLQTKFLGLAALSAGMVIGVVALNHWMDGLQARQVETQVRIGDVMRRHVDGDMQHDAIHSGILAAALAATRQDSAALDAAEKDVQEQGATFEADVEGNLKEDLPADINDKLTRLRGDIQAYTKIGESTIADLRAGGNPDAALDKFTRQFELLEGEQATITDDIKTWSTTAKAQADSAAQRASVLVLLLSAGAVITMLLNMLLLWHQLLRPLGSFAGHLSEMARGNIDFDIAQQARGDEIGILARAMSGLRGKVAQAYQIEQMVRTMGTPVMSVDVNDNLKINFVNEATMRLLKRIENDIPIRPDDILGQSIDIFHKNPQHQRRLLADPKNLPFRANIKVGPETIDLKISAVYDHKGRYTAAMLIWDIATQKSRLTQEFEGGVQDVVSIVAAASEELSAVAGLLTQELDRNASLALSSSNAASETAGSVQSVAAAAEELSSSVREISNQIQKTHEMVRNSYAKVQNADAMAQKLAQASDRVSSVTEVIAAISSQINLLALNATIESARAGEAGRGFAVVAGEVKNLANQTHRSIGEINTVISEMRTASGAIITALHEIRGAVDEITNATTSVASAVEEQSATTQEIARNMAYAADGTQVISQNLREVSELTSESQQSSSQLSHSSQDLSEQANALRGRVDQFLLKMNSVVEAA